MSFLVSKNVKLVYDKHESWCFKHFELYLILHILVVITYFYIFSIFITYFTNFEFYHIYLHILVLILQNIFINDLFSTKKVLWISDWRSNLGYSKIDFSVFLVLNNFEQNKFWCIFVSLYPRTSGGKFFSLYFGNFLVLNIKKRDKFLTTDSDSATQNCFQKVFDTFYYSVYYTG